MLDSGDFRSNDRGLNGPHTAFSVCLFVLRSSTPSASPMAGSSGWFRSSYSLGPGLPARLNILSVVVLRASTRATLPLPQRCVVRNEWR